PWRGGQWPRPVVFIPDVTAIKPAVQHAAVGGRGERPLSAGVGCRAREQVGAAAWPAAQHAVLLDADLTFEVLVDGDCGLTVHLVVAVAQVGGAASVVDQAVETQG